MKEFSLNKLLSKKQGANVTNSTSKECVIRNVEIGQDFNNKEVSGSSYSVNKEVSDSPKADHTTPIVNERSDSLNSTNKEVSSSTNTDPPVPSNNERPGSPNVTDREVSGTPILDLRISINEEPSDSYIPVEEETARRRRTLMMNMVHTLSSKQLQGDLKE